MEFIETYIKEYCIISKILFSLSGDSIEEIDSSLENAHLDIKQFNTFSHNKFCHLNSLFALKSLAFVTLCGI